jgi:hypothetical protein
MPWCGSTTMIVTLGFVDGYATAIVAGWLCQQFSESLTWAGANALSFAAASAVAFAWRAWVTTDIDRTVYRRAA